MSTLDEAEAYLRDLVAKASRRSLLSTFMCTPGPSRRWSGRKPGGGGSQEIGETTPCKAGCRCTLVPGAERTHERERHVGHPQ